MEEEGNENIGKWNIFFCRGKENGEGKGGKYLEMENIICGGKGKGGNYFEKGNIFWRSKKQRKKKQENICRRKISRREEKRRRKGRKIFGEGYFFLSEKNREGKGRNV